RSRACLLQYRSSWSKMATLLVGIGYAQGHPLFKRGRQDLQAHRQIVKHATWHRDAGDTSHVRRKRTDIAEVHLVRVIEALAKLERHYRRYRRHQGIAGAEHLVKFRLDQGAGLLGLPVVSVRVPFR